MNFLSEKKEFQSLASQFGGIRQLAFVPADFDSALKFWTEVMGVGPFFYLEHIPLHNVRYRGELIDYDCSAAIAFWGDIEIELLRQHNEGDSILTEWLRSGREGLHHVRIQADDFEEGRRAFEALGAEPVQEAALPGGSAYIMYDMKGDGPIVEMSWLDPQFEQLFAYMKRAAKEWDGQDPLRPIPPEEEWAGKEKA